MHEHTYMCITIMLHRIILYTITHCDLSSQIEMNVIVHDIWEIMHTLLNWGRLFKAGLA